MMKLSYPSFWQSKTLLSYLLIPFSLIYYALGLVRNLLSTPCRLPAKVVCVGNSTVGGTGKTQTVMWLAKKLKARGAKAVILCKGYKGKFSKALLVNNSMHPDITGDEALELCEHAPTVIAKKPADALQLLKDLAPDIIISDDGMQNPSFIKDFIIMVVDGKRGFGNKMLIPAGPMRQFALSSIEKADAIFITDYVGESDNFIINSDKVHKAVISPEAKFEAEQKYYAFTGIGNPERFFALCRSHLGNVVKTRAFADHHNYTAGEIEEMQKESSELSAGLVTTVKDYTKLKSYKYILPLKVMLEIENGDKIIDSILK